MPIYAYQCSSCGFQKDVLQKFSDAPLTVCPSCGKAEFHKQLSAPAFQLKGTGWYVTDFRDNGTKPAGQEGKASAQGGASGTSGESSGGSGASSGGGPGEGSAGASASPASAPAGGTASGSSGASAGGSSGAGAAAG